MTTLTGRLSDVNIAILLFSNDAPNYSVKEISYQAKNFRTFN